MGYIGLVRNVLHQRYILKERGSPPNFLFVLAGYIIQTNKISIGALVFAAFMAFLSGVEIKASRPYKDLKRRLPDLRDEERGIADRFEAILKNISLGVILLGAGMLMWRIAG